MPPLIAIPGWALFGASLSCALRPVLVRSLSKASPDTTPPPPGVLEGLTALLFAALAYRVGPHVELLAFSALVTTCVPLAATDLIARRLPNVLIGTAYISVLPLLGVAAAINHDADHLVRATLSMTAALAAHGMLYAAGGIAGGDLKLVGVLGAALGWISWTATWTGLTAGWLTAGLVVFISKLLPRKKQHPEVPLGPFLITGTLVTLLVSP